MNSDKRTKLNTRYSAILRETCASPAAEGTASPRVSCESYRSTSKRRSTDFFYQWLEGMHRGEKALPKVGYFCNIVPDELITACGAYPVRLCNCTVPAIFTTKIPVKFSTFSTASALDMGPLKSVFTDPEEPALKDGLCQ